MKIFPIFTEKRRMKNCYVDYFSLSLLSSYNHFENWSYNYTKLKIVQNQRRNNENNRV